MRNVREYGKARAPVERSDLARYADEPISDYWQALWRVFAHLDRFGEYYDKGPLPFIVLFVADMFWVHPEKVRRDLIKLRKSL